HTKEYIRHLGIARGSLFEAETQIIIANRLGYASEDDIHLLRAAVVEIGRMLHGLIVSLERKIEGGGG
ncbi:MAG TPA: four helix bundle protein, partial [Urbifossiella sp.]|nr:four helix bundle protein [Urbifossiella sp.]